MEKRKASHAGNWYPNEPEELSESLGNWLKQANSLNAPARAIIAPHAAYQYSGFCAAFAYKQIDPSLVRRIFILGPAHFYKFSTCALSKAKIYETPLCDLKVDVQVNDYLKTTGVFELMDLEVDEQEHSIEMHLPYIAKLMMNCTDQFTIVPILIGYLSSSDQQKQIAKILSVYLTDPKNLFVISSDFCHWGQRFRFTYQDNSKKPLYQCIEELDKIGMDAIENLDPLEFHEYLKKYGNTICGKFPILILLHAVKELLECNRIQSANLKFLKYAQSSKCQTINDSSVSYASASLIIN